MKKLILSLFIIPLYLLHANEQKLTISTGFNSIEAKFLKSVLLEAFTRAHLKLDFQILPNQRSLISANDGVNDGEAARVAKITKIYTNLVRVNVPYHNIDIIILSKKNIHINKTSDLRKYNIGVVRGVKITENIAKKFSTTQVKATNYISLIKMLLKNRIDIIIVNKIGAYTTLAHFKNQTFYAKKTPLASPKLYMFLNKKNKSLIPKLQKAFQSMSKDGTIKKMNKNFNEYIKTKLLTSVKVIEYD